MPRPVLVAALGVLTVALDAAVNIAFPAISAAFHVPATSMQWIVLTYMATFAVALIPAGRLGDRIGHARVFRSGLGLTGLTHVLCGLAPAWSWLLGVRVAQGVGAALVMASAPALATLTTEAGRRGRALGGLGLAASLGAVVGPLGGGLLVDALGWRVVYLGRLPLVLTALALGRGLRDPRAPSRASHPDAEVPLARGAFADQADRRTLAIANAALLLGWVALFAVWLLVPYYLIDRRGFPAGWGGVLFMIGPLAQAGAAPVAGRLTDRGAGRWLPPLGLALEGAGLWLTGRLDDVAGPARIAFALGLGGLGSGLFIVANMHYVMAALPPSRQGVAGSLVALMRTAGVVAGAIVTTAVYAARLSAHAPLGERGAAAAAFADAFTLAAAIAGAAALLSLIPPRPRAAARGASAP
ncbi:MAG TPA: MFS transporter [Methylomirabilota bacterium]|jgi:MFS family permease